MQQCVTCRQHNVRRGPAIPPGIQAYGAAPFEDLQVNFTEMAKCGGDQVWIKDWNVATMPTVERTPDCYLDHSHRCEGRGNPSLDPPQPCKTCSA
nr:uncharacterized protein LOC105482989 isoform X2 [Macaca nemestrina]